jgi:hypothetical protein
MARSHSSKKPSKSNSETPTLSLKELAAQKRQAAKDKQEFISFTTSIFFSAVVIGLLLIPFGGPKAAIGAIAGIVTIGLSYKYPHQALWAMLVYLPFSGTVTYALAGGNALFQLAKDAFYIPALIKLIQEWRQKHLPILMPKEIKTSLGILLVLCLITLLISNGGDQLNAKKGEFPLAMGILGLKVLLGYLPLITCGYRLINSKDKLLKLTRLHTVLAIICCILGLVQYYFLSSGRCTGTRNLEGAALFRASLDARCLVGGSLLYSPDYGVIRLPGTFVSPWHWAWFLISNAFLTYATAFSDPSPIWRIGGLVGMAVVFVNAVISGQRIALILVPIVTIILLVLTGQVANLKRFLPIAIGLSIIIAIGAALFPQVVEERINSMFARWAASPPTEFIAGQAEFTSKKGMQILGEGLGTATASTKIFGSPLLIETFYPKLLYEIGPMGVLGFLGLVTSLTVVTFKAYRSIKEPNLRSFGASFWVFILVISYNTYWYPLDTDPVAIYYWFLAGVIMKLPEIDREEKEKIVETGGDLKGKKKFGSKSAKNRLTPKPSG